MCQQRHGFFVFAKSFTRSSLNGSALRCMLTAPLRNRTRLRRGGRLLLGYPRPSSDPFDPLALRLYAFGSSVRLATKHNCFQHGGAGVVSASLARRGGSARSQTAPPYAPPCLCLPLSPCLSLSEFMIMSCGPGGKPQTSKLATAAVGTPSPAPCSVEHLNVRFESQR
jgi:hypothetical protein